MMNVASPTGRLQSLISVRVLATYVFQHLHEFLFFRLHHARGEVPASCDAKPSIRYFVFFWARLDFLRKAGRVLLLRSSESRA